jgi:hypothetical protein
MLTNDGYSISQNFYQRTITRADESSWMKVSAEQFEQLQVGKTYMLNGRKGKIIEKDENANTGTSGAGYATSARMVRVQWK